MVDLAGQVEASVDKGSQKFQVSSFRMFVLGAHYLVQALLKLIYVVFANEVSTTESPLAPYLSLYHPPFNPESILTCRRFPARRTKLGQNIVQRRKYTGEQFGIGELPTRSVVRCIAPIANGGWDVGGVCAKYV
jgi:GC-rich sequence DNA-binding factor